MEVLVIDGQGGRIGQQLIKAILSRYRKHWQQRLLAHGICLLPLAGLVHRCFRSFSRQFLQIKTTPNFLFGLPT